MIQGREQLIRVIVKKPNPIIDNFCIKFFDGQEEYLALYKYVWGEWNNPIPTDKISEGIGNGNGKAEIGETFAIWIQTPSLIESKDEATWHPTIPLNNKNNADIIFKEIKAHKFNTRRPVLSAQM